MHDLIWKTFVVFLLLFFFFWVIFYTYQPAFMSDDDFVNPTTSTRGADGDGTAQLSDKYLSDKGRTLIFLVAILIALGVAFLFYVIGNFYDKEKGRIIMEDNIDLLPSSTVEEGNKSIKIKYDLN